jgi:hypothetical protein
MGDHPDPPSFTSGYSDPPSFTPGYSDPPSWSNESNDPASWAKRSGIPAQSRFSTESQEWLLPNQPSKSSSTIRANRPTASPPPSANLSIIHTANLLDSSTSPDEALTNFETNISPWKTPKEYIEAEATHVNTTLDDISILTGREEIEEARFIDGPMIYSVSCNHQHAFINTTISFIAASYCLHFFPLHALQKRQEVPVPKHI